MADNGVQAQQLPQGKKRVAEDGLENEQRLSKRFNQLKIGAYACAPDVLVELLCLTLLARRPAE